MDKFSSKTTLLLLATLFLTAGAINHANATSHQKIATASYQQPKVIQQIVFAENFDPPGSDAPPETKGAGSRTNNQCLADKPPIQSLMPPRNYSLTTQVRPTIFLRIPAQQKVSRVILTFRDEQLSIHSQTFLPIQYASTPVTAATVPADVVQLQLPADQPELTAGKNYRWSVVLLCGDTPQPDDPIVSGWVQRVSSTVQMPVQSSSLKLAKWQAKQGYWHDMLATLWNQGHPIQPAWQQVLNRYTGADAKINLMSEASGIDQSLADIPNSQTVSAVPE